MKTLWFDSCMGGFYLALSQLESSLLKLDSVFFTDGKVANQVIKTESEKLLQKNNTKLSEISYLCLNKGPGSFTGIKLSASYCLGVKFAQGENLQLKSYCGLEELAKVLSKTLVLKSTKTNGFYFNPSAKSPSIVCEDLDDLAHLKDSICWGIWDEYSSANQKVDQIPDEQKKHYLDQMVRRLKTAGVKTLENFGELQYLKEPFVGR